MKRLILCISILLSAFTTSVVSAQVTAEFSSNLTQGCGPLKVSFFDQSTGDPTTWLWDFGNATTSTEQNPIITYPDPGQYTVKLTVSNGVGTSEISKTTYITVKVTPTVDFTAAPTTSCIGESIKFLDGSSNANQLSWNFGDGVFGTGTSPSYVYKKSGRYTITLTAFRDGCKSSEIKEKYIVINPPTSDFTFDINCNDAKTVVFKDKSDSASNWQWDFGDGFISTEINPTHTYLANGTYKVRLTTTNIIYGCLDTFSRLVEITGSTANLDTDTTQGCFPLEVQFQDLSTKASSVLWDFGDGTTSTLKSPSHTFSTKGSFTVSLKATDSTGCSSTLTIPNYITTKGPEPGFTQDTLLGCSPLNIVFTDTSFTENSILSYQWEFGDGKTGVGSNPNNIYTLPGDYFPTLTIMDADSCTASWTIPTPIQATSPTVGFNADKALICKSEEVSFNNYSTGKNPTYLWDFGDGSTSDQFKPKHTYITDGDFDVSLTVTDENGCDTTLTKPSFLSLKKPKSAFFNDPQTGNCPPLLVNFTDTSLNGASGWKWDFGGGNTSTDQNPSITYDSPGLYDVSLIITTDLGCSDTLIKTGAVEVLGPQGDFQESSNNVCLGTSITFTATSQNATKWSWDFGDGEAGLGQSVVHTYSNSGEYSPLLTLEDANGCKIVVDQASSVVIDTVPIAGFISDGLFLCRNGEITFTDTTFTTRALSSHSWNFGDGGTSTSINPTHTFQPGLFDITLIVQNELGCSDTAFAENLIEVSTGPTAISNATMLEGCIPLEVGFTNSSSGPKNIVSNIWDFGDGASATTGSPSHTFDDDGDFNAQLIITDEQGCEDTTTLQVSAYPLPFADFDNGDNTQCFSLEVLINDFSSGASTWEYDFGDGFTSAVSSPIHSYEVSGTYDVFQKVTNQYSCSDSITKQICVKVEPTLHFPNAFAPNSTNQNKTFKPVFFSVKTYTLQIFNRWGQKVFETTDPNQGWDGTFKGEPSTQGTYIYAAFGVGETGESFEYKGVVYLTP